MTRQDAPFSAGSVLILALIASFVALIAPVSAAKQSDFPACWYSGLLPVKPNVTVTSGFELRRSVVDLRDFHPPLAVIPPSPPSLLQEHARVCAQFSEFQQCHLLLEQVVCAPLAVARVAFLRSLTPSHFLSHSSPVVLLLAQVCTQFSEFQQCQLLLSAPSLPPSSFFHPFPLSSPASRATSSPSPRSSCAGVRAVQRVPAVPAPPGAGRVRHGVQPGQAAASPTSLTHPPASLTHPPASLTHPPASLTHPPASLTHPPASLTHPPASLTHPPASLTHPPASLTHPPASLTHPPASLTHPPASLTHPPASLTHPPTSLTHPPASLTHPPASLTHPPGSLTHPPGSLTHPPGSLTHPPGSLTHPPASLTHPPTCSLTLVNPPTTPSTPRAPHRFGQLLQAGQRHARHAGLQRLLADRLPDLQGAHTSGDAQQVLPNTRAIHGGPVGQVPGVATLDKFFPTAERFMEDLFGKVGTAFGVYNFTVAVTPDASDQTQCYNGPKKLPPMPFCCDPLPIPIEKCPAKVMNFTEYPKMRQYINRTVTDRQCDKFKCSNSGGDGGAAAGAGGGTSTKLNGITSPTDCIPTSNTGGSSSGGANSSSSSSGGADSSSGSSGGADSSSGSSGGADSSSSSSGGSPSGSSGEKISHRLHATANFVAVMVMLAVLALL
ncbi:unnamed protein product [Closterium sp. Naga37s-1]|nr:unnamed protein product [Closterium sp. Naga37s-1]